VGLGSKILHPADDQGQTAFDLGRLGQRLSLLPDAREPLLQAGDAGPELALLDHPLGVAVDQPAGPPAQALDLAIEGRGLAPVARAPL